MSMPSDFERLSVFLLKKMRNCCCAIAYSNCTGDKPDLVFCSIRLDKSIQRRRGGCEFNALIVLSPWGKQAMAIIQMQAHSQQAQFHITAYVIWMLYHNSGA